MFYACWIMAFYHSSANTNHWYVYWYVYMMYIALYIKCTLQYWLRYDFSVVIIVFHLNLNGFLFRWICLDDLPWCHIQHSWNEGFLFFFFVENVQKSFYSGSKPMRIESVVSLVIDSKCSCCKRKATKFFQINRNSTKEKYWIFLWNQSFYIICNVLISLTVPSETNLPQNYKISIQKLI